MIDIALIPDRMLSTGVLVIAWPDGMWKANRRRGTLTKESDPDRPGDTRLVLKLDDGRVFINPSFPMLPD